MGITNLIEYVRVMYDIADSVKTAGPDELVILEKIPIKYHPLIRKTGKRIVKCMLFGIALPLVLIPIAAPLGLVFLKGIAGHDALWRGMCLLFSAPVTVLIGIAWGLAVGMLVTPKWYLQSPLAARWRKLAGVESVAGIRILSAMACLVGSLVFLFMVWIVTIMKPFS